MVKDHHFTVVTEVRILYTLLILRDRVEVARKAHNLEVIGSNPVPATTKMLFVCVFHWYDQELKGPLRRTFFLYISQLKNYLKMSIKVNLPSGDILNY